MKKLLALLLSLLLLVQLPAPVAFASFESQDAGARAPGMADAFTAVADDADSIVYNPAGLIQLQEGQITSQYGQLVKGLDDGSSLGTTYLGYAHPLVPGYRTLGFAYHNFKADNLFNERTLTLSYGQRLDLEPYGLRGISSFGANLKQLHRQYEPDRFTENALNDAGVGSNQRDQLFNSGNAKDTYAIDLGGLVQFGAKYQYTAGLALINLNEPDVSLAGDGDKAPMSMKAGLGYRPRWGTLTAEMRQTERLVGQKDNDLALGAERNIPFGSLGALIARGGYASGSRGYKALTMGLSYLYSRFRLDYAFNFPVGNFADTTGSHRMGFSFKMGSGNLQLTKDYSNADLLAAFKYSSLATHMVLTRLSVGRNYTPDYKNQLMLLLIRKYPLDDAGLQDVSSDLRDLLQKYSTDGLQWPQLRFALLRGIPEEDKTGAIEAIEALVRNDAKSALVRLSLLPISVQKSDRVSSLMAIALTEIAAKSYRSDELDICLDAMRRLVEIMPADEVVLRAYRTLLARRAKISESFSKPETDPLRAPEETQEAPQTLVAPKLQQETPAVTPEQATMQKSDETLRAFGTALGYYMVRKSAAAPVDELIGLLNQMKAVYGASGIDMSLIDRELLDLINKQPTKPAIEPVVKPAPVAPKPANQPADKPAVVETKPVTKPVVESAPTASGFRIPANADLQRAWIYYESVSARDISDHEKLELLKDMLRRYGEQGADRINKELSRIRRRLER